MLTDGSIALDDLVRDAETGHRNDRMSTEAPSPRVRSWLVACLLVATTGRIYAQPAPEGTGRGYFGAPVLEYTTLRDQDALVLGGRGGWNATRSLTIGGALYGTVSEVDARAGVVTNAPGPLDLEFEMFALEVEYALRPMAPIRFTLGTLLGGAAARYVRDGTDEQHGETDFLLLAQPALGVERSIERRVHLQLVFSYRLIGNVEQEGLGRADLDGPGVALSLKLGRFP